LTIRITLMGGEIIMNKFFYITIFNIFILLLRSSSFAGGAGDLKAGEKLYKGKCSICHGEQGQGAIALKIKDPAVLNKQDEELRKFITDGGNGMPAYAKSLKPEEIDSLVAFLRSWAEQVK